MTTICTFWSTKFGAILSLGLLLLGCGSGDSIRMDQALEFLYVDSVGPAVWVPGTVVEVKGEGFVDGNWGRTKLVIDAEGTQTEFSADYVDLTTLHVTVQDEHFAGEASLRGEVYVEVESFVDGQVYRSNGLNQMIVYAETLTPVLSNVEVASVAFVNDKIEVTGEGLLLGTTEGASSMLFTGCYRIEGSSSCFDIEPVSVPIDASLGRAEGVVLIDPAITGIRAGTFEGQVMIENHHSGGSTTNSSAFPLQFDLQETTITGTVPSLVSLGQYWDIQGFGFIPQTIDGSLILEFDGTLYQDLDETPISVALIPEFKDGNTVRYVMSEDDTFGGHIPFRDDIPGLFIGMLRPIVQYQGVEVTGDALEVIAEIGSVRQVVHLVFRDGYVESLREYGVRALDDTIRQRVVHVIERDFDGVNLEVRMEEPTDFAQFATVEINGDDPNGIGLFGYDNSPGKDVDNLRLYDRIGGANATTQQDGYPGFGGVFVRSFFGFSEHPVSGIETLSGVDPWFDFIFDETRIDRGGQPASKSDPEISLEGFDGTVCPSDDRATQLSCAAWVLGNLIGSTVSHELGHSLGLANPYGSGFHYDTDHINRLMDAGSNRPFRERAELDGDGPSMFCDDAFEYLQDILPTDFYDETFRPVCD